MARRGTAKATSAKGGTKGSAKGASGASRSGGPAGATRGRGGRGGREDVVSLLKADHRAVEELFKRYRRLGARAAKSKRDLVQRMVKELSMHAAVEEQTLYPTIRQVLPDGDRVAEEAIAEHQQVKDLLAELAGMDPADEGHDEKVRTLMTEVKHHVKEEERGMLARLKAEMDRDALISLGQAMRMMKKTAPTRPHPYAPSTPPANLPVGMAAGVVDRVRDAGRAIVKRVKR